MTLTKPAPFASISSLTGIVACALLASTEARAVPYVVTIDQVGPNVVATSNEGGEFDTAGAPPGSGFLGVFDARILPREAALSFGSIFFLPTISVTGPNNFEVSGITGTAPSAAATSASGPILGVFGSMGQVALPANYVSGQPVPISQAIWDNRILDSPDFATGLGVQLGTYTWRWGAADDQTFTINAVPSPIVGAGLPGLIAALGG